MVRIYRKNGGNNKRVFSVRLTPDLAHYVRDQTVNQSTFIRSCVNLKYKLRSTFPMLRKISGRINKIFDKIDNMDAYPNVADLEKDLTVMMGLLESINEILNFF